MNDRVPSPEELEAYLGLSQEEVARVVLCLLIGEALRGQMADIIPALPREASPGPERTPRRSA
jgi:hypothetical protein